MRQLRDEGMPVLGNSHVRGALFISFEVKFPERQKPGKYREPDYPYRFVPEKF